MLADIPATLPQAIRDADATTWRDWMDSRNVSTRNAKRVYVRHLTSFYQYTEEPIMQTDETGIHCYEQFMRESGKSEATITHTVRTVRSYWKYAREQKASTV